VEENRCSAAKAITSPSSVRAGSTPPAATMAARAMSGRPISRCRCSNGNHAVVGSWVIEGRPAGIGMREDERRITHNNSRIRATLFRTGRQPMSEPARDCGSRSTGGALAADVHGVDLSKPLGDAAFARIAQGLGRASRAALPPARSSTTPADEVQRPFSASSTACRSPRRTSRPHRFRHWSGDAQEWVAVISSVVKDGQAGGRPRQLLISSGTPTCPYNPAAAARLPALRPWRCRPTAGNNRVS